MEKSKQTETCIDKSFRSYINNFQGSVSFHKLLYEQTFQILEAVWPKLHNLGHKINGHESYKLLCYFEEELANLMGVPGKPLVFFFYMIQVYP